MSLREDMNTLGRYIRRGKGKEYLNGTLTEEDRIDHDKPEGGPAKCRDAYQEMIRRGE